jgi:hypothetical protein
MKYLVNAQEARLRDVDGAARFFEKGYRISEKSMPK